MTTHRGADSRLATLALTVLVTSGCTCDDGPGLTGTRLPNTSTAATHAPGAAPAAILCPEVPHR